MTTSSSTLARSWAALPVLRAARGLLLLTGLGASVASCGGGSAPLLEELVIHPRDIDWEHVLEAREALETAASEYPFSHYGDAVILDGNVEPQFTYYVPVGTPVYAPVTGRVVRVEELYSHDFTIQIGAPGSQAPVWEVEHVIGMLVEEGDDVVAGQRVATASNAACENGNETYCKYQIAVVEFGILTGHGHECPYAEDWVSPEAATDLHAELDYLYDTVGGLIGGSPFDHSDWETPYCRTLETVDPR